LQSGFTLIEIAVAVAIITLLIGALLVPLSKQVEQRNVADTQLRLQQIHDVLIAFAITHGRFPCPADGTGNGVEKFATGENESTGKCYNPTNGFFKGYVPGVTLGLSNVDAQGYALDAWGFSQNRIRYAITDSPPGTPDAFTKSGGMNVAGIQALGNTATKYLYVCASAAGITNTDCGTVANTLSNGDAVFVLYSLGKNAGTSPGGAGADEQANQSAFPRFVSKTAADATGNEFDDLLLWGSRYSIVGRIVAAGQLP
jgi:prepilin-type N-terminal cleavage/methylation domain-containing protein